jgi:hypothetical protein
MLDELEGPPRARRIWLFSPAIATALFFAAQLLLATFTGEHTNQVKSAGAQAPTAAPVKVRVVTQIRNLEDVPRQLASVPKSEAALIDLCNKNGFVVFSSSEVEAVGTQERKFGAEEVGVITADSKLRAARFVR